MSDPRLLLVAHGTASAAGAATTRALLAAVRGARSDIRVELAFLDVVGPSLAETLDDSPTVVVPLLLSTGYHVQSDIPSIVAGRPRTRVAPHLGPHPLVIEALLDRLLASRTNSPATTVLVGAGSSRPEAMDELRTAAALLGDRLGREVPVLTMADDLPVRLRALPRPAEVATYLLAEGHFVTALESAAAGVATVAAPLGVHAAIVELIWQRYDDAATDRPGSVR